MSLLLGHIFIHQLISKSQRMAASSFQAKSPGYLATPREYFRKPYRLTRTQHVPRWSSPLLTPTNVHLQKVSGAMTNAVFFVSFNPAPNPTSPSESPLLTPTIPPSDPSHPPPLTPDQYPHTLLFRVYGPSSDALISRSEELRILHVLSTQYGIGPRIFGTFTNGRVEEFFPSRALTAQELRDPIISRGIARRMRELHSVDLRLLGYEQGRATEPALWICLKEWSEAAEDVISSLTSLGGTLEAWVERLSLHRIQEEISIYRNFVESQTGKGNGVVFARTFFFFFFKTNALQMKLIATSRQ